MALREELQSYVNNWEAIGQPALWGALHPPERQAIRVPDAPPMIVVRSAIASAMPGTASSTQGRLCRGPALTSGARSRSITHGSGLASRLTR